MCPQQHKTKSRASSVFNLSYAFPNSAGCHQSVAATKILKFAVQVLGIKVPQQLQLAMGIVQHSSTNEK